MKNAAEVKNVIKIDHNSTGMEAFNPTHIQLINEDHLAIVILGVVEDEICIYTTEGKNSMHEVIDDDHVKCIAVHSGHVYMGLQSGNLTRIAVKSFLKGKLQKDVTCTMVNENRPILSMAFGRRSVVVCSGGYLYQYPLEFTKNDDDMKNVKLQKLHARQRIVELLKLPLSYMARDENGKGICSNASDDEITAVEMLAVRFECLAEVQIVELDTFRVVAKIELGDKILELTHNCEESDRRVTTICAVCDVLWVGTGSGHIFVYDIGCVFEGGSCDNEVKRPDLLTVFQPYSMELRKLCLWEIPSTSANSNSRGNNSNDIPRGVEFLVVSTGKKLNADAFGGNQALCKLTSDFPPEDERVIVQGSPTNSVTSFDTTLKNPEGKTILFWYASDAKTMRILMRDT